MGIYTKLWGEATSTLSCSLVSLEGFGLKESWDLSLWLLYAKMISELAALTCWRHWLKSVRVWGSFCVKHTLDKLLI